MRDLRQRTGNGNQLLATCWGSTPEGDDDREAAASDAISNILTALCGPAGHCTQNEGETAQLHYDSDADENARALLRRALASWQGDAEDYTAEDVETEQEAA